MFLMGYVFGARLLKPNGREGGAILSIGHVIIARLLNAKGKALECF